jgi:ferredoxin
MIGRTGKLILLCAVSVLLCRMTFAAIRYAQPSFEKYTIPTQQMPAARAATLEALDVAVLFLALSLAGYLALRRRSRRGLFLLTLFSLLYFGFWRKGCICSIGAIQNVTTVFYDNTYLLPVTALAFFLLPLLFTLLFGRVFCAAVCPLGSIQDIVALRPMKIPPWLASALGLLAYLYLGLAILLAATGTGYLICRFDPFVSFFRLSGHAWALAMGAALLAIGVFVARPYCRFLCPYGVLLNWASRFSRWRVTITPEECVQCRLCEEVCPYDAILKPNAEQTPERRGIGMRRLTLLVALAPLMIALCGWIGSLAATPLSFASGTVRLASQLQREDAGLARKGSTVESDAYRTTQPLSTLYAEAWTIRERCRLGGWIFGGFIGLTGASRLIGLSVRRTRKDYEPDRGLCLSCGRCFEYCPVGKKEPDEKNESPASHPA